MEYWSSGGLPVARFAVDSDQDACRAAASMRSMYRATRVCLCELANASLMGQIEQARRPAFQANWESSAAFAGNTPNSSRVQLSAYGQSLGRFGSESEQLSPVSRAHQFTSPTRALGLKRAESSVNVVNRVLGKRSKPGAYVFCFPATWRGQLAAFCCCSG